LTTQRHVVWPSPLLNQLTPSPSPSILNETQVVSTESLAPEVRQAAAVNFKNYIKYHWVERENTGLDTTTPVIIPDSEKDVIKTHITNLMLNSPPKVRVQLSEALAIISGHDFPFKWPTLLPQLLEKLTTTDEATLNGVLNTADSIYLRYRGEYMTATLSNELEYSQKLVIPLLNTLKAATARLPTVSAAPLQLAALLENVRLIASIFLSLNSPGLTQDFEDTLDDWMDNLHKYLMIETPPALVESDPDKEGVVEAVKGAICEALGLFMEKNEEEFAKYLQTFVEAVWKQVVGAQSNVGYDRFVMAAIGFLTAVARSVHFALFGDAAALRQICEGIIIPNIRMREDLEEAFEMNWLEYIRRDTEGSDNDTRRRAASELVKALTDKFPSEVTTLFTGYVSDMLGQYTTAPAAQWKAKDCAMYLVTALAVKGKTVAAGATSTNALVNIPDFYNKHVAPDLAPESAGKVHQVLVADALKFVTTFRAQLPQQSLHAVFPGCVEALKCESNVVHSYAAVCVERLLALKVNNIQVFTPDTLGPYLQPLLERLFSAFHFPESKENEYLMRCVMRVISFVGNAIAPVAPVCIQQLSQQLLEVCKNPTQPGFNHYLFESVAALIKYGCAVDPSAVVTYEEMLFPPFQIVLQEDVQEFHPYVFQIFAQLIESRSSVNGIVVQLPETYYTILPPLLTPLFWERPGNIPALVRLVEAYLTVSAPEIVKSGHLQAVLGVFQKLLSSKAHGHEAFYILNALVTHVDLASLTQYLPHIWGLLFQKLQSARTTRYVRSLLVFLGVFIAKHGCEATSASIDAVQPGLLTMLVQQVWVPSCQTVQGKYEEKIIAVGGAKILADYNALPSDVWCSLLFATVTALESISSSGGGGAPTTIMGNGSATAMNGGAGGTEEGDDFEFSGYSAAYAKLHNASRVEQDPIPDVQQDIKLYLAQCLASAGKKMPGRVPGLIGGANAYVQGKVREYAAAAGVSLV